MHQVGRGVNTLSLAASSTAWILSVRVSLVAAISAFASAVPALPCVSVRLSEGNLPPCPPIPPFCTSILPGEWIDSMSFVGCPFQTSMEYLTLLLKPPSL
jgi:hypothetical protein